MVTLGGRAGRGFFTSETTFVPVFLRRFLGLFSILFCLGLGLSRFAFHNGRANLAEFEDLVDVFAVDSFVLEERFGADIQRLSVLVKDFEGALILLSTMSLIALSIFCAVCSL